MTAGHWPAAATAAAVAALAAAVGVVLALLAARAGPLAVVLPLVAVAATYLLLHPRVTLVLLVGGVILFEGDEEGFLGYASPFYDAAVGPHEVLVALAAVGVLLERLRTGRPLRAPGPFTLPLALGGVALVAGLVTGSATGAAPLALINDARDVIVLLVLPFVVANAVRSRRDLQRVLVALAILAGAKAVIGAAGWAFGQGRAIEGTVLTYYEPLANLVLALFVLAALAAVMDGAPPRPLLAAFALLAFVVLMLSFRRNFWIALAVGAVVVVLVGTGARGRLLLVPAALAVAVGLGLGLSALNSSQSTSPVIERAQSLAPSRLQNVSDDRYRLDEQRNVRAELADHPLTGLGLGVPWEARQPLAEYFPGGRGYTHVVAFWWWLKLGLLGLVAYVWITATAVRAGVRLWGSDGGPWLRRAGLAAAAGTLGLAVAETTGSFTGVEPRLSVFVGVMLGLLGAAVTRVGDRASFKRGHRPTMKVPTY